MRRHFIFVYIQRVYNLHLQYGGDLLRQLIAENDRALSGRDIRYLVPFRPEPEPEPNRKKRPDILLTGTGYPVHP